MPLERSSAWVVKGIVKGKRCPRYETFLS
jgi:hypothetical protein